MIRFVVTCDAWRAIDEEYNRGICSLGNFQGRPTNHQCVSFCGQCTNTLAELQAHTDVLAHAIRTKLLAAPQVGLGTSPTKVVVNTSTPTANNFIALAIQYCGQVCGKRHTTCPVTICMIRRGFQCPEDKWKNIPR